MSNGNSICIYGGQYRGSARINSILCQIQGWCQGKGALSQTVTSAGSKAKWNPLSMMKTL